MHPPPYRPALPAPRGHQPSYPPPVVILDADGYGDAYPPMPYPNYPPPVCQPPAGGGKRKRLAWWALALLLAAAVVVGYRNRQQSGPSLARSLPDAGSISDIFSQGQAGGAAAASPAVLGWQLGA